MLFYVSYHCLFGVLYQSHLYHHLSYSVISFLGFYCPPGQTVPNPNDYQCPLGYYCVEGSESPQLCPSGSYQDQGQSSSCKQCPEGFYCDNAVAPVVNYTSYECPEGKTICQLYQLLIYYHLRISTSINYL